MPIAKAISPFILYPLNLYEFHNYHTMSLFDAHKLHDYPTFDTI
jgi:hypothetical protein